MSRGRGANGVGGWTRCITSSRIWGTRVTETQKKVGSRKRLSCAIWKRWAWYHGTIATGRIQGWCIKAGHCACREGAASQLRECGSRNDSWVDRDIWYSSSIPACRLGSYEVWAVNICREIQLPPHWWRIKTSNSPEHQRHLRKWTGWAADGHLGTTRWSGPLTPWKLVMCLFWAHAQRQDCDGHSARLIWCIA